MWKEGLTCFVACHPSWETVAGIVAVVVFVGVAGIVGIVGIVAAVAAAVFRIWRVFLLRMCVGRSSRNSCFLS